MKTHLLVTFVSATDPARGLDERRVYDVRKVLESQYPFAHVDEDGPGMDVGWLRWRIKLGSNPPLYAFSKELSD